MIHSDPHVVSNGSLDQTKIFLIQILFWRSESIESVRRKRAKKYCEGVMAQRHHLSPLSAAKVMGYFCWRTPNLDRNGMFHPKNEALEFGMILTSSHVSSQSPNHRGRPKTNSPRGTGPVSVTDDYDDDDLTLLQARSLESSVKILEWLMAT